VDTGVRGHTGVQWRERRLHGPQAGGRREYVRRRDEMARKPSAFRQSDVTRALKAMAKADVEGRVEIATDGTITIITGKADCPTMNGNPWDEATEELMRSST
jgi:hypothetical protein